MSRALAPLAALVLTVAVAAPVRAQTAADAALRADIEQLLEVTGAFKTGLQMAELLSGQLLESMRQTQPEVPERAVVILKDTLSAAFAASFHAKGEVGRQIMDVYARHLSHDDVKALLVFYRSDVGRRSIAVLPLIVQESADVGKNWAEANLPGVLGELERRLRSEGLVK